MKKILLFVFLIVLLVVGAFYWWNQVVKAPVGFNEPVRVVIAKGSSASRIAKTLEEDGAIRSVFAFKFYTQLTGVSTSVQAGEYKLDSGLNMFQITQRLLSGPSQIWVTVPEGLRREEIVEEFIGTFGLEGEEQSEFRASFLSLTRNQEGYLFPDTYLFKKDATGAQVVSVMLEIFDKRMAQIGSGVIEKSGLTQEEIVILASMLERETVTDVERPVVAGILLKRLKNDWPLQIDATVQYAVASARCSVISEQCDWWPRPLTLEDIEMNSPYNTYRNTGYPLGPIASPGLSSLKAVVGSKSSEYWFYIHDSNGKIHYGRTLEEHNSNIARYLGK